MSGTCSIHRQYDSECSICRAMLPKRIINYSVDLHLEVEEWEDRYTAHLPKVGIVGRGPTPSHAADDFRMQLLAWLRGDIGDGEYLRGPGKL